MKQQIISITASRTQLQAAQPGCFDNVKYTNDVNVAAEAENIDHAADVLIDILFRQQTKEAE